MPTKGLILKVFSMVALLLFTLPGGASDSYQSSGNPGDYPPHHGDDAPSGDIQPFYHDSPPAIAIPAVRDGRNDGQPGMVGFRIVTTNQPEILMALLQEHGIVAMPLSDANLENSSDLSAYPSASDVERVLDLFQEGVAMSHPEPVINDLTAVPVTLYADPSMRAISGWQDKVHDAFTAAHVIIYDEANIHIYQYWLMNWNTDVTTYCLTQQVADYEYGWTHRGALVFVYSAGKVSGDGWTTDGVALNGYLADQISGQWIDNNVKKWKNHCNGNWETTTRLPVAYTRGDIALANMQLLNAHEAAHLIAMRHIDGDCYVTWPSSSHVHRTVETYTSATSTLEPDCQTYEAIMYPHFHWELTTATEQRMWAERQRWTTCYNSGC